MKKLGKWMMVDCSQSTSFFGSQHKKEKKQTRDKCLNNEERKGSDSSAVQRSAAKRATKKKEEEGRKEKNLHLFMRQQQQSLSYPPSSFKAARWGDDDDDDVYYPIQSTGHTQTWQIAPPSPPPDPLSAQYTSSPFWILNCLYILQQCCLSVYFVCIHTTTRHWSGAVLTSMVRARTIGQPVAAVSLKPSCEHSTMRLFPLEWTNSWTDGWTDGWCIIGTDRLLLLNALVRTQFFNVRNLY